MIEEIENPEWPVIGTVVISEEEWVRNALPQQRVNLIEAKVHDLQLSLLDYMKPRLIEGLEAQEEFTLCEKCHKKCAAYLPERKGERPWLCLDCLACKECGELGCECTA